MARYDVVVAGLGAMGSATAAELARRGLRVLGLERFGAAHDQGASHGGSRIIRDAYYEGRAYVPLVRRARQLWRRLEQETGQALIHTTGGIYGGDSRGAVLAGSIASAEVWDVPHEVLDAAAIRRRFPTMAPSDGDAALYEPGAGFIPPELAVRAQLAVAARHGADLHFGEPAEAWSATSAGVDVRTLAGRYAAGALVLTPGAWARGLLPGLDIGLRVERRVQYWFVPSGPLDRWLPDHHPVWIWDFPDGASVYGFPMIDGGVKFGLHSLPDTHPGSRPVRTEALDRSVGPDEVAAASELVRRRLPELPGRHLRDAVCTYTLTPDHHFVVGLHPGETGVVIGCGFSGHGFKFAPVIGGILADLSTTGRTSHDITTFDPVRPVLAGRA